MVGDLVTSGEAEVKTGPFGTQLRASDYVDEGTPVINVRNIGFGGIRKEKLEFIADETVQRLSSHLLKSGDIVFGRKGAVERHVFIRDEQNAWFQGSDCLRLRLVSESRVLARFLSYVFLTKAHQFWMMQQCSHGATMASLNQDIIKRIQLSLPPLTTQRHIASILSTYDDLIENNTRRIAILEEMARRLYEEWFVKFRFPGHEEVSFVDDDEVGRHPNDWERKTLKDYIELAYGKALKASDRVQGPYPVFGSSGVVGSHNNYLVEGPGIIVGRKGNVGSVHWTDESFCPIDTVYYVKTKLPLEYVFFNLQHQNFINNDAAVPGLNRNQAYSLPFLRPSDTILDAFKEHAARLYELIRLLQRKNTNLRAQRDLLLPKLVSGQIDVSEVELPGTEEAAA
ncbi:MAG: restriction endonuclease subunit S [Candidatus Sedimenticola sp. (ex Thyasira tokunagai)]